MSAGTRALQGIMEGNPVIKGQEFSSLYMGALCLNVLIKCAYISENVLRKSWACSNIGQSVIVQKDR